LSRWARPPDKRGYSRRSSAELAATWLDERAAAGALL
jgi:hypothetical protein